MPELWLFDSPGEWAVSLSEGVVFAPHHTYDDETEWIDGSLRNPNGEVMSQIDIGSTAHGEDGCISDNDRMEAVARWDAGTVYSYTPYPLSPLVLLIPDKLTRPNIAEALQRFRP